MGKKADLRSEPDREPREQFAALPWRRRDDGQVEVLLITSRDTRRWVIPKGWPIKGLEAAHTAAQEAFEEAGVKGRVGKKRLGAYHYDKRLQSGRLQHVRVTVYPLEVEDEMDEWPEKDEREKFWVAVEKAAPLVDEPELTQLIGGFSP